MLLADVCIHRVGGDLFAWAYHIAAADSLPNAAA